MDTLKIARLDDKKRILDLLKENIGMCIYMYIDISKYGLDSGNISVWYMEKDDSIKLILMKYYDSFQIYFSNDFCDYEVIEQFINKYEPKMISGDDKKICELAARLGNSYCYSKEYVFDLTSYKEMEGIDEIGIENARMDEFEEIARLICSDKDIGGHYSMDGLTEQLKERYFSKMGRNLVIRKDNKIVTHIATYAEYDKLAVTSGLISVNTERTMPYGTLIESYLVKQLREEGYKVYTFVVKERRRKLLMIMGNEQIGLYGKLVKNYPFNT